METLVETSPEILVLPAQIREQTGTGPARLLRRNGMVPAIVYGAGHEPLSIALEEKEITKLYRKRHFISTVFEIEVNGKKHKVLPKAVELHPITDIVRHVDFIFIGEKEQKMQLPVVFEGKERAIGVKRGGFFNIVKRTIPVVAPSNNIPRNVTIDVTNMYVGQSIKASSLKLPEGCTLLLNPNFVVASITGRGGKADAEEAAAAAAGK